jgi:hypothetical protein
VAHSEAEPLDKLLGSEVSQVIFVMGYLQIVFHGWWTLSFYAWPNLDLASGLALRQGVDERYEHELVRLIGQEVSRVSTTGGLLTEFDEGTTVFLPATAGLSGGCEFGMLNGPDHFMWVWRTDTPPFAEHHDGARD